MADTTIIPIDVNDPFLDKLDFLNTGAHLAQPSRSLFSEDVGLYVPEEGNLNKNEDRPSNARGQYAAIPGATPKYSRHRPSRARENFDTMARMYIRVLNTDRIAGIKESIQGSVGKDVANVLLGDGSSQNAALGYVDFFMDSIQTNLMEKVQVTEVLEDNFVAFFFGMSPPSVLIGGHVMNTIQDDWAVRMLSAYESIFRGTMLARRGLQFYLRYDSYILSGACTALTLTQTAANETVIPFTLQLLVHRRHLIYGDAYKTTLLPASAGAFIPDGVDFSEPKPAQLRPFIAAPSQTPTDSINNTGPVSGQEEDYLNEGSEEMTVDEPANYIRDAVVRAPESGTESTVAFSAPPSEPNIRNYMKR